MDNSDGPPPLLLGDVIVDVPPRSSSSMNSRCTSRMALKISITKNAKMAPWQQDSSALATLEFLRPAANSPRLLFLLLLPVPGNRNHFGKESRPGQCKPEYCSSDGDGGDDGLSPRVVVISPSLGEAGKANRDGKGSLEDSEFLGVLSPFIIIVGPNIVVEKQISDSRETTDRILDTDRTIIGKLLGEIKMTLVVRTGIRTKNVC